MVATERPAAAVLHLSLVVGGELVDSSGKKLRQVEDLIVRLGEDEYPPVTGALATVAGREVFVGRSDGRDRTTTDRVADRGWICNRSTGDQQEVLLKKDVLDRQLINVDDARLVRSNEIELARLGGWYRVVGVDVCLRGLARRLLPRALASTVATGPFLDWASVEPSASAARRAPAPTQSPRSRTPPQSWLQREQPLIRDRVPKASSR
jgi:hypothetical protein